LERKKKILSKAHHEIAGGKLSFYHDAGWGGETMGLFDFRHGQFGGFQNAIIDNTWSNSWIGNVWMNYTWWENIS
jgi:hypothetical protein